MKIIINIIARFFKVVFNSVQYALSFRVLRYLLLAVGILFVGYKFGNNGKKELRQEIKLIDQHNKEKQEIYKKQISDLKSSLDELAKKPTTQTIIKHVKVKDKATFSVNKPIQTQIDTNTYKESLKPIILTKRQKRRMMRFEKKIQRILKKASK